MITIFVSSTFKDMQAERDALQESVAPALNETAKKYGKSVSFSDLRWGVNTLDLDSEKGARKVLDVCLDEIDRCEPPMVVILGYRYGWIPSQDTLKNSADRKNMILQDLEMSVTALEIEYGALRKAPERTLFYFREIDNAAPDRYLGEDEEHTQKLNALKDRIDRLSGRNLRTYHVKWNGQALEGIDGFARTVERDILKMLLPEWEKDANLTPFERERNAQWTFAREKAQLFRAKTAVLNGLIERVQSGEEKLIIKGAPGMGKSTLFCALATGLKEQGYDVLPFIGGYTLESNDSLDILKNEVYYIEEKLALAHFKDGADATSELGRKQASLKEWRDRLEEVCGEYAATGGKLVIMLDAADQLNADGNRDDLIFIPYNLSGNVRFIMTCTEDFPVLGDCVTLTPLNDDDRREIIRGILEPMNKELDDKVISEIIAKKGSGNALYVSLLVQRLLLLRADDFDKMTDPQTISLHQREILSSCPDELDEMSAALFTEAGMRINGALMQECMEYIAATRHGLRATDLAALTGERWNYLDFIHFAHYMRDSFMVRDDGRFDFTHKSLRRGFSGMGAVRDAAGRLADYLLSLAPDDAVRMSEIGYHLILADRRKEFVACVTQSYGNDGAQSDALVKDLYELCCIDEGAWLIKILQSGKEYGVTSKFCLFISDELTARFNLSRNEISIAEDIMLANMAFLEELNAVKTEFLQAADGVDSEAIDETDEAMDSYADAMNQIIGELFNQGLIQLPEGCEGMTAADFKIGADEFKESVAQSGGIKNFLKQSSTVAAYSDTIQGDIDDVRALSSCYRALSNTFANGKDSASVEMAINVRERSILLNQALYMRDNDDIISVMFLCDDYIAVSKYYLLAGTERHREMAAQTADEAMKIASQLADRLEDPGLSSICASLLSDSYKLCAEMKSEGNALDLAQTKEQLALYEKALKALDDTAQGAQKMTATAEIYKSMGLAYEKLSATTFRGAHYRALARKYYLKSAEIYERLYKESPDLYLLDALADSYQSIASEYHGNEEYAKAIEYIEKTIAYRKILHDKLKTDDSGWSLADAYSLLADIYLEMHDERKYGLALDANKRYLELATDVDGRYGTVDSGRKLSAAYTALANTYKVIGGEDNLRRAYELLKKKKALERRLEIRSGVPCDENLAFNNYHNLIELAAQLKDGKALTQELLELGEEELEFYRKIALKSGSESDNAVFKTILITVADAYAGADGDERAAELYEEAAEIADDLYSYYTALSGKAKLLLKSGRDEDAFEALALYKKFLEDAEIDTHAEILKSAALTPMWIMECADSAVKLLERLQPDNLEEIEYYTALSAEYLDAMLDYFDVDADDSDDE